MPSPDRIAEIEARLTAATPGSFTVRDAPYGWDILCLDPDRALWIAPIHKSAFRESPYYPPDSEVKANADLFAHAPSDLRYLLDSLSAAERKIGEMEKVIAAAIAVIEAHAEWEHAIEPMKDRGTVFDDPISDAVKQLSCAVARAKGLAP